MSKKGIKPLKSYEIPDLKALDIKILKQEFTRERDILRKRHQRLKSKGFNTEFVKYIDYRGLPKMAEVAKQGKNLIVYWVKQFKAMINEDTTVSGARKKRERAEKTIDELELKNTDADEFGDFMEYLRSVNMDVVLYGMEEKYYRKLDKKVRKSKENMDRLRNYFDIWKANDKSFPEKLLLLR